MKTRTREEKLELINKVKFLKDQGNTTTEKACKSLGISGWMYYNWIAESKKWAKGSVKAIATIPVTKPCRLEAVGMAEDAEMFNEPMNHPMYRLGFASGLIKGLQLSDVL